MSEWTLEKEISFFIYQDDRAICQCYTEEDALKIVNAVNRFSGVRNHPEEWLLENKLWGKSILTHVAARIPFMPDYLQDDVWLEVQRTISDAYRKLE